MSTAGDDAILHFNYGRDQGHNIALAKMFHDDIEKIISALNGSAYDECFRTIGNHWLGPDFDQFKNNFNEYLSALKNDLRKIDKLVETTLRDDYDTFVKNQASHYKNS